MNQPTASQAPLGSVVAVPTGPRLVAQAMNHKAPLAFTALSAAVPSQAPYPVAGVATPQPPPPPGHSAPGSRELPSIGSAAHAAGRCKPCAFAYTKGCANGLSCPFCHLCDADEKKRRRKEKVQSIRTFRRYGARREGRGRDEERSWAAVATRSASPGHGTGGKMGVEPLRSGTAVSLLGAHAAGELSNFVGCSLLFLRVALVRPGCAHYLAG